MSRMEWVLSTLLLAEVATAGLLASKRLARPLPPLPDLQWMEERTASDLRALWSGIAPEDAAGWKRLADAYLAHGYFAEAEAVYRRAADLDADAFEAAYGRGVCLDKMGLLTDSVAVLRGAVARTSNPANVSICQYRIGKNLLREEQAAAAEAAFTQALPFPHAAWELAKLQVRSGRAQAALPLLQAALERYPQGTEFNQLQAEAWEALGLSDKARRLREQQYYAYVPVLPDLDVRALHAIRAQFGVEQMNQECQALEAAGTLDQAATSLRELLRIEGDSRILLRLIQVELQRGAVDEATRLSDWYLTQRAPTPQALELFGAAWLRAGNLEKARETWARAAKMGEFEGVHQGLASIHEKRGEAEAAQSQRALALHAKGLTALREQRLPVAQAAFEQALTQAPGQAQSWFYLGETLRLSGATQKAGEAYRRCVERDPFYANDRARARLAGLAREGAKP